MRGGQGGQRRDRARVLASDNSSMPRPSGTSAARAAALGPGMAAPVSRSPRSRASPWAFVLPAVLAVVAHAGILRNDFAHDDHVIVGKNPVVQGNAPWTHALTKPYWPPGWPRVQYRPLTTLSLRIDHRLGHGGPWPFHAVNLAWLAIVVSLLSLVLRQRGASTTACLVAAATFAAHPMHVEAVAPAVGRSELGAAAFALLALAMRSRWSRSVQARGRGRWGWVAAIAGACLAAMLFKEHAIVMPGVLAIDAWLFDAASVRARAPIASLVGAAAAVGAAFVIAHVAVAGGASREALIDAFAEAQPLNPLLVATAGERWLTAISLIGLGAKRLILPWPLVVDRSGGSVAVVTSWIDPGFLVGAAVIAAIAVLAWKARDPLVRWSIATGALFYLPVSQLPFPTGVAFAERTWFLPSIALAVTTGVMASRWLNQGSRWAHWATGIGMTIVLGAFAILTVERVSDWRNSCALAAADVRHEPLSSNLLRIDGTCALDEKDLRRAALRARQIVEVAPRYATGHLFAAQVHGAQGDSLAALESARIAVRLRPEHQAARGMYADMLWATGHREESIRQGRALLRRDPRGVAPRRALAEKLALTGRVAEARALWREGLEILPHDIGLYREAAVFELLHGGSADIDRLARQAVAAHVPGMAQAWIEATGQALTAGKIAEAHRALGVLLTRHPDEPGLLLHEAAALRRMGDIPSARAEFEAVLRRLAADPSHPIAQRARRALAELATATSQPAEARIGADGGDGRGETSRP